MKNKFFVLIIVFFCYFVCIPSNIVLGAPQTPQELVTSFYAWYMEEINKSLNNNPIRNDEIYKYVHPCTVNKCRIDIEQALVDSDYFLSSNDFDYEYFKKIFVAHDPISISDSVSLVPVGGEKPRILVFAQKTSEGWRIIKVESISIYAPY